MWFLPSDQQRARVATALAAVLDRVGPAPRNRWDPAPSHREQLDSLNALKNGDESDTTIYLTGGWQISAWMWGQPTTMYHGPVVKVGAHFAVDDEAEAVALATFQDLCRSLDPLQGAWRRSGRPGLLEFGYIYARGTVAFVQIDATVYEHFIAVVEANDYWLGEAITGRAGLAEHGFLSELVSDEQTRAETIAGLRAADEGKLAPFVLLDQRPVRE